MAVILETLLSVSVYAAIIFCAIMLFKKLAKNKISPVLQYALWLILVARLVFPFTVDSGFHFYTAPPVQMEFQNLESASQGNGTSNILQSEKNSAKAKRTDVFPRTNTQISAGEPSSTEIRGNVDAGLKQNEQFLLTKLSTEQTVVLLWILGVGFVMVMLIGCRTHIVRRMNRGMVLPNERIGMIMESCKKELGIRGKIPLRLCAALLTPALTVSFRPKLLLPLDLYCENDMVLRCAILHELTHYKRGDYILRLVMNALKAVWWFNPIVWLADRQIVLDMETACDSMVVKHMKKDEKRQYANIVLEMFSAEKGGRYILGMALGSSKKVAEQRIRGIYMKQKTKRSAKLAAVILAGVMGIACFTTACSPAQAADTQSPAPTETMQAESAGLVHIKQTLDTEQANIKIEIDADVLAPDAQSIPQRSYEVRSFTQQDADNAILALMGGKELYAPIRTKADIQKDIDNMDPAGVRTIEEWKEELKTAPETPEKLPAQTTFEHVSFAGEDIGDGILQHSFTVEQDQIVVWADAGDSHDVFEMRTNSNTADGGWMTFRSGFLDFNTEGTTKQLWTDNGITYEGDARSMDMTREQAEQLAIKTAQALDPAMTLAFTEMIPVVDWVDISKEEWENDPEAAGQKADGQRTQAMTQAENAPQVYRFHFTRSIDGVQETYTDANAYYYESKEQNIVGEYNKFAEYEQMSITIGDDGILEADWFAPGMIGQPSGDGALISVDDAIRVMQYNLLKTDSNLGGYVGSVSGLSGSANIQEIRLGYARVMNEDETFKFVPVWDFFGAFALEQNGQQMKLYNTYSKMGNRTNSLFSVNALDGSIVFRREYPFWLTAEGIEMAQPSSEVTDAVPAPAMTETEPISPPQPSAMEDPLPTPTPQPALPSGESAPVLPPKPTPEPTPTPSAATR